MGLSQFIEEHKASAVGRVPSTFIYGMPGIGKTVFMAQHPKALWLTFEETHQHVTIDRIQISNFKQFQDVVLSVKEAPLSDLEKYDTIVIDTLSSLVSLAESHIAKKGSAEHISDMGYGKGWAGVRDALFYGLIHLMNCNNKKLTVVMLTHAKIKTITTKTLSYSIIEPDIPNYLENTLTKPVSHTLFFTTEGEAELVGKYKPVGQTSMPRVDIGDTSRRVIMSGNSTHVQAKDHFDILPDVFPLSWPLYNAYITGKAKKYAEDGTLLKPEDEAKRLNIELDTPYWR